MITTAEGVETKEQLDILRVEGCTQVQGFLYSQPQPVKEIPALLPKAAAASPRRLKFISESTHFAARLRVGMAAA